MLKAEEAIALMKEGFHCSQAVLSVFAEELGLDQETALRISCGFGGGMGCLGGTCGAVTGAFMVISLKYGKTEPDDLQADAQTMGLIQTFDREFKALHKTTFCRELIDYDISTPQGFAKAKESGVFADKCLKFVEDAVNILETIL